MTINNNSESINKIPLGTIQFKYFIVLLTLFSATWLISNIAAVKLVSVFGIVLTGGFISAPIKLTFDEIVNDFVMLSNFASKHASWIGYYYGKHYNELINKKSNYDVFFDFSIDDQSGKFNILMLDRHGNIIYLNKDNNTTCSISPVNAITNEHIISKFTPIQACYIGILAGTSTKKMHEKKIFLRSSKARLKLIT